MMKLATQHYRNNNRQLTTAMKPNKAEQLLKFAIQN